MTISNDLAIIFFYLNLTSQGLQAQKNIDRGFESFLNHNRTFCSGLFAAVLSL